MSPILGESSFDQAVVEYLHHQRMLGRSYSHEGRIIDNLCRFLKRNGYVDLGHSAFEAWCACQRRLSACQFASKTRPGFARKTRPIFFMVLR